MRNLPALVLFGCCGWLWGCGALPDLPDSAPDIPEASTYPDFIPIEQIAYDSKRAEEEALETEETLDARVAGLKARAERLRRTSTD